MEPLGTFGTARSAINFALSALFEPPCAACKRTLRAPLDGAVCEDCWAALRRGRPLQSRDCSAPISWWCAVDHYEGRLKEIIHALKYDRRQSISPRLGALMRHCGSELLVDADAVVPVPLHPRREYQRGFNQAESLAPHLGIPVMKMLKRVKHTRSQIELPKASRQANVQAAFALQTDPRSLIPELRVVVLIDDVATTGATLSECATVLKRGGVAEVRALTAARVV